MKTQLLINTLSLLLISLLLTSCGGGSENGSTPSEAEPDITTKMLFAPEDFDFSLERERQLSIVNPHGEQGAIHLYHGIDYEFADGSIVPDPQTRITSIDPNKSDLLTLSLNKNITQLIWHWVPTQRNVAERIEVIKIENNTAIYLIHL